MSVQASLLDDLYWMPVKDGDVRVFEIYKRHYSYTPYQDKRRENKSYRNRHQIMGPGEKFPLLGVDGKAIFGWRKFINDSGEEGVNCCFFRNEGAMFKSSELILRAEKLAWSKWPGERLYTYVNEEKIRGTNPGYCYLKAGWSRLKRRTKWRNLVILEKLPE